MYSTAIQHMYLNLGYDYNHLSFAISNVVIGSKIELYR